MTSALVVAALAAHRLLPRGRGAAATLLNAPTGGPIDWDGSAADLDEPGAGARQGLRRTPSRTLKSTADWPDLRYSFRDQRGRERRARVPVTRASRTRRPTTELLAEKARSDVDGNGVNDLADACRIVAGTDVADANGNGFADACEPDMNRLQAFPQQPGGSGGGGGGGGGGLARTGEGHDRAGAVRALGPPVGRASARRAAARPSPRRCASRSPRRPRSRSPPSRSLKGRKAGKRCVAGGKQRPSACTLYKRVAGSLRVNARAGANTVSFAAKLGTKKLGAGTFRLTAVAIDAAGNRSKPQAVKLTVR